MTSGKQFSGMCGVSWTPRHTARLILLRWLVLPALLCFLTLCGAWDCPLESYDELDSDGSEQNHQCSCGAGTTGPVGGPCKACAAGTHKGSPGSTECEGCAPGTFAATTGSVRCEECPLGSYAPTPNSTTCTSCPAHATTLPKPTRTIEVLFDSCFSKSSDSPSCSVSFDVGANRTARLWISVEQTDFDEVEENIASVLVGGQPVDFMPIDYVWYWTYYGIIWSSEFYVGYGDNYGWSQCDIFLPVVEGAEVLPQLVHGEWRLDIDIAGTEFVDAWPCNGFYLNANVVVEVIQYDITGATSLADCTCTAGHEDDGEGVCRACPDGTDKWVAGPARCTPCAEGTYHNTSARPAGTSFAAPAHASFAPSSLDHVTFQSLQLQFVSEDTTVNQSFVALVEPAGPRPATITTETQVIIDDGFGVISDGPGLYKNGLTARWILAPKHASAVSMFVEYLDIEEYYDMLHVEECDSVHCASTNPVAGSPFWNPVQPGLLVSRTGVMRVTLETDAVLVFGGFSAVFVGSAPLDCAGASPLMAAAGFIHLPAGMYASGVRCEWEILGAADGAMQLSFVEFGAGPGMGRVMASHLVPDSCVACPAHSTSLLGSFAASNCTCDVGHTGPDGAPCAPCAAGRYKDAIGPQACEDCPPHSFASAAGSAHCAACPTGTFADGGASSCQPCAPAPLNAMFDPEGAGCVWLCMTGFYAAGARCVRCPANKSAPLGSTAPNNCSSEVFLSQYDDWKVGAVVERVVNGSTIVLDRGEYTGLCNVSVTVNLELRSMHGADATTLNCRHESRHLHVDGAAVSIVGITLSNGHADDDLGGGCVLATRSARVRIERSEVRGCTSLHSGGAIHALDRSVVEVTNSAIVDNWAVRGGAVAAAAASTVRLQGSVVADNVAVSDGGALLLESGSVLDGRDSQICDNTAGVSGGGLHAAAASSVTLLRASLAANQAVADSGGGAYLLSGSVMRAEDSALSDNAAGYRGGGAYALRSSVLELRSVVVERSLAGDEGGGLNLETGSALQALNSSIVQNRAFLGGGGVFAWQSSTIVLNLCRVAENECGSGGAGVQVQAQSQLYAGNTSIVRNEGSWAGAVNSWEHGVVMVGDSDISENLAAFSWGSAFVVDEASFLHVWNSRISNNSCLQPVWGIGAIALDVSTALLQHCELKGNYAHDGGVVHLDDSELQMEHVTAEANEAAGLGGVIAALGVSTARLQNSTLRGNSAGGSGGCVFMTGSGQLSAHGTSFSACEAGHDGGALALSQDASAVLTGRVLLEGCSARSGGAVFAQGGGFEVSQAELTVRDNSASLEGGGILSVSPVHLRSGTATLQRNHAGTHGGGWAARGYRAQIHIAPRFNLEVVNCSAAQDGGGMALLDVASIVFEGEACSFDCSHEHWGGCGMTLQGGCMTAECNWFQAQCSRKFEVAGDAASKPCSRSRCRVWMERHPDWCYDACSTADCDWSEANPWCRSMFQELAVCPLWDAVVYNSYSRSGLTWVKHGGTAGGFGRCDSAGCHPMSNSSTGETACRVLDDEGRILLQHDAYDEAVHDGGEAWGVCSHRPRLPVNGFDYNPEELLSIAHMKIEHVLKQFPGCGQFPLRLADNVAGRRGGGLFRSGQDDEQEARGSCFLGDIPANRPRAMLVLFEGNRAQAGGGMFLAFPRFEACKTLMETKLGLPSVNGSLPSLLEFRGNAATLFGSDVATDAKSIVADVHQTQYSPGQAALDFTIRLYDALNQTVNGAALPSMVQADVCPRSVRVCDSFASIQPTLFMLHDGPAIATMSHRVTLEHCPLEGDGGLQVRLSLPGRGTDNELGIAVHVDCMPCQRGQARKLEARGSGWVWRCERCLPSEYVLDPNLHACTACPAGARCDGASLTGILQGSVWVSDLEEGIFRLVKCPSGHFVVNNVDGAAFDQAAQRCAECPAGADCTSPNCTTCSPCRPGHYKSFVGTAECQACPSDTYRARVGAQELADCLDCPKQSSTRGAVAQVSIDNCTCNAGEAGKAGVGYYGSRTAHGLRCFQCPTGAECPDGVGLLTRAGLDATGQVEWAEWESDTDEYRGRLWLQRCPQGFRLENSTGYELQECQAVPAGMFIASNSDSRFRFQRCPENMLCVAGGLPTHSAVSASLQLSRSAAVGEWSDADTEASRQAVRAAAQEAALQVEVSRLCLTDQDCRDDGSSRGRRMQQAAESVTLSITVASQKRSSMELKDLLEGVAFKTAFEARMAAFGISVMASITTQALAPPQDGIGTHEMHGTQLVLVDCPAGFLLANASVDSQECIRCAKGTYSFDPTDGCSEGVCQARECNSCPAGAECEGLNSFRTKIGTEGAVWLLEQNGNRQRMRLSQCPAGHVLVRSDLPTMVAFDQCVACRFGKYSVALAIFPSQLTTSDADAATELCLECPKDAVCAGRNLMSPNPNFWIHWDERALVNASAEPAAGPKNVTLYQCGPNACLGGNRSECDVGREGPICGVCKEGYAFTGTECQECGRLSSATSRFTAGGIGVSLALLVWYYAAWKPYFAVLKDEDARDETARTCCGSSSLRRFLHPHWQRIKVTAADQLGKYVDTRWIDYAKIVIGFYQVASTFQVTLWIEWPRELEVIWSWGSFLRFDWIKLPGIGCLAASSPCPSLLLITRRFMLVATPCQASTLTPLVVAFLLVLPSLVMMVQGQTGTRRFTNVANNFWYFLMFWLFLIFPPLSVISVEGFNCQQIGTDNLLMKDLSVRCPLEDKTSPAFVWAVLATVLFPVGLPVFMYIVLRRNNVPQIAQKKMDNALLHQMLLLYKHVLGNSLSAKIAAFVGAGAKATNEAVVLERAEMMFNQAGHGASSIDFEMFINFLHNIAISGNHEDEVKHLMISFDDDNNGTLEFPEFLVCIPCSMCDGRCNCSVQQLMPAVRTLRTSQSLRDVTGARALTTRGQAMIQEIVDHVTQITGFETWEKINEAQLEVLCSVPWYQFITEEDDETNVLGRELKKRLKKAEKAKQRRKEQDLASSGRHLRSRAKEAFGRTASEDSEAGSAAATFRSAGSGAGTRAFGSSFLRVPSAGGFSDSFHRTASKAESKIGVVRRQRTSKELGADEFSRLPSQTAQEEVEPLFRCELTADSTREERQRWVLNMGHQMVFAGAIAVPALRWDGETEEESAVIDRLGFLFDAYKVQYWYFELVEMARKFVMSALISYVYPGSPQQAAAGLFITLAFLMKFLRISPYASPILDTCQAVSLMTQAATLFYGLVLALQMLVPKAGEAEQAIMKYLVLICNVAIFALPLGAVLADPHNRFTLVRHGKRILSCWWCLSWRERRRNGRKQAPIKNGPESAPIEQSNLSPSDQHAVQMRAKPCVDGRELPAAPEPRPAISAPGQPWPASLADLASELPRGAATFPSPKGAHVDQDRPAGFARHLSAEIMFVSNDQAAGIHWRESGSPRVSEPSTPKSADDPSPKPLAVGAGDAFRPQREASMGSNRSYGSQPSHKAFESEDVTAPVLPPLHTMFAGSTGVVDSKRQAPGAPQQGGW